MNMIERFDLASGTVGWNFSVRTVTPELAKALLEKNHGNRNLRSHTAARYAAIMKAGNWIAAPEPIVLGKSGRVLNGQHRLSAVIMADVSATFCFITGVEEEAFKVIDRGMTRSTADALSIPRNLVEVSKVVLSLMDRIVSDDQVEVLCAVMREPNEAIEAACSSRRAIISTAPMRSAAVIRLLMGDDPEYVTSLYRNMVLGHFNDLPPVGHAMMSAIVGGRITAGGLTATRNNFARGFFLFDPANRDKSRIAAGKSAVDSRIETMSGIIHAVLAKAVKP
jgi:hypothetical protein